MEACVSDSTEAKRQELLKLYPSQKWRDKVIKMSPAQVTAIYIRIRDEGKLGK
jgi:hypothetical protein